MMTAEEKNKLKAQFLGKRIRVIIDDNDVQVDSKIQDVVLPLEVDEEIDNTLGLFTTDHLLIQVPGPEPATLDGETTTITFQFGADVTKEQEEEFLEEVKEALRKKGGELRITG